MFCTKSCIDGGHLRSTGIELPAAVFGFVYVDGEIADAAEPQPTNAPSH